MEEKENVKQFDERIMDLVEEAEETACPPSEKRKTTVKRIHLLTDVQMSLKNG